MISISSSGSFKKTEDYLRRISGDAKFAKLDKYAREGLEALRRATPTDTGETANAWYYTISNTKGSYTISWRNAHMENGISVVILLQYGHGTGTGGYVQGRDFINPAIKPVFDRIAEDVWRVVTSS